MAKKQQLIAYKHNRLIYFGDSEVKKLDALTKNQMKIVTLSATKVNSDDEPHKVYEMSFREFAKLAKIDENNYDDIYKEAKKLARLGVDVIRPDGAIMIFNWLNSVIIEKKSGKITYEIDKNLLPFYKVAKASKQFSKIHLLDYMPLQSKYSVRLYEFLAKWQNAGKVYQTIEQLRQQLQVEKNKYTRVSNFVARCITEPLKEISINAKNAFSVKAEYEYGNKKNVIAVTFFINKIKSESINTPPVQEESSKPTARQTKKFKNAYDALQNVPPHPDQIPIIDD